MVKVNLKGNRPKSKAQILQKRRNKSISRNHFDLLEERVKQENLFLENGAESSSDSEGAPNEISFKRPYENNIDEDENDVNVDSEIEVLLDDEKAKAKLQDENDAEETNEKEDEIISGTDKECDNGDSSPKPRKRDKKNFNDIDDGDNGIFEFKIANAEYKVVALNKVHTSTFIKPRVVSRKELLRKTTKKVRAKEKEDMAQLDKWRRVF